MSAASDGNVDRMLRSPSSSRWADWCRRLFDIAASASLAIVTLPVVLILAVGSAVAFRAWPIFCHERVGKDGKQFCCLKLRTLPTSIPNFTGKHDLALYEIPAIWRLIRRWHLDELPQLYVVLIGRMSMIGPRPEMAFLHEQMEADFAGLRTSIRPGCSGLWQVSTAISGLILESPEYDRFYLEHRSLRLDLWIFVQTVKLLSGLARPIELNDIPSWALRPTEATVIDLRDAPDARQDEALGRALGLTTADVGS